MKNTGLILVVIVICMVGVASTVSDLFSVTVNGIGHFPNQGYRIEGSVYVWEREIHEPLEHVLGAVFRNINGNIEIEPHTDPTLETAEIHAVIKLKPAWLSNEEGVLSAKTYYDAVVERNPKTMDNKTQQTLIVKAVHPRSKPKSIAGASIHFKIKVPKRLQTEADSVNGRISVQRMEGQPNLTTVNGGISVQDCPGLRLAESVNGSVKLHGVLELEKTETVNGSIEVHYADHPARNNLVETVNGSVQFFFPKKARYNMEISTTNGGIHFDRNRFEGTEKKRYVKGNINGGGAELRIKTVNGSVSLRDA